MYHVWRVAVFSAIRQIRRASLWTTVLTIFIMVLTFLNMVTITGILVGLVEGSSQASRRYYSGDLLVTSNPTKDFIEETREILTFARGVPQITAISPRYTQSGSVEANYRTRTDRSDRKDQVGTTLVGVNIDAENQLSGLNSLIVEGDPLFPSDQSKILIGSALLDRYSTGAPSESDTLENVFPGDKVRISVGDRTKEYEVKGIVDAKNQAIENRVFFVDTELRKLLGRSDLNVDEIAMLLSDQDDEAVIKDLFVQSGVVGESTIETAEEAIGEFLEDIKSTFSILGTALGSLALIVAAITIFIVIFINALNRKKFIGIQKAIGIQPSAIILSYVFQAIFYALIGITLATLIIYFVLVPYFMNNPINFPFSDGILFVTVEGTAWRALLLMITTIIAGWLPARSIVKGNTLDAMLGR